MSTQFEKITRIVTSQYASMSIGQRVLAGFGAVAASVVTYIAYYRVTEKMKPFNSYTTSDEAINGLDLTGKYAIVTGCNTGKFLVSIFIFADIIIIHIILIPYTINLHRHW